MNGGNDRLRVEVTQVLDEVRDLITGMAEARQRYERLTASASAENGRVVVVVDASGAVTEVEFADDVDHLGYHRIGRAVVQAAQDAARKAKQHSDRMLAPLRSAQERLPKLSDYFEPGSPMAEEQTPPPPPASLTPPGARDPGPVRPAPAEEDAAPEIRDRTAEIVRVQNERAELYATGAARGRRVMVAVNADGVVIDLKFAPAVGDLEYDEIADAITAAAREAVREVARKVTELFAPLAGDRPRYPGAEAMLSDIGRFRDQLR